MTKPNSTRLMWIGRILPNHGDPDIIARGGYTPDLIAATSAYVRRLLACRDDPDLAAQDLRSFVAAELAGGALCYHPAYEAVHRRNVAAVTGQGAAD